MDVSILFKKKNFFVLIFPLLTGKSIFGGYTTGADRDHMFPRLLTTKARDCLSGCTGVLITPVITICQRIFAFTSSEATKPPWTLKN